MALAPIAIKLGMNALFDRMQELAHCQECGRLGAQTTAPSWGGLGCSSRRQDALGG